MEKPDDEGDVAAVTRTVSVFGSRRLLCTTTDVLDTTPRARV